MREVNEEKGRRRRVHTVLRNPKSIPTDIFRRYILLKLIAITFDGTYSRNFLCQQIGTIEISSWVQKSPDFSVDLILTANCGYMS